MTSGGDWSRSSDGSRCTSPPTYSPRAHSGTDWPTPRPACWPGSSNDGCTGPTTAETSTPCSPATTYSPTQRSTGPATPSPARSARTPTTTGTPGHPPMTGRQSSRHRPGSRSSITRTPRESTARKSASSRFWQATAPLGTTTSTSPPTPTAATSSPGRSRNNGPPTWSTPSSRNSPRHQHEHHPLQRTADPEGRRRLAALAVDDEWTLRHAAERFQCSPYTAFRWTQRYRAGEPLTDRSSRPGRSPSRTVQRTERRVVALRCTFRWLAPARHGTDDFQWLPTGQDSG